MMGELLSLGGNLLNNFFAGERQSDAQEFSAQQFASRYQNTVADMKAAGLSPMLAYGQGGGNAPTSSAASAASSGDLGMVHLQSKLNSAQVANIEAQTRKTDAERLILEQTGLDQARATLDKTLVDVGLSSAQIEKVNNETINIISQLNNIRSEDDRIKAAAGMLRQQAQLFNQQNMTEAKRILLVEAQAREIVAKAGISELDLKAAKEAGNFGREFGQLKPFFDMLLSAAELLGHRRDRIVIHKRGD